MPTTNPKPTTPTRRSFGLGAAAASFLGGFSLDAAATSLDAPLIAACHELQRIDRELDTALAFPSYACRKCR